VRNPHLLSRLALALAWLSLCACTSQPPAPIQQPGVTAHIGDANWLAGVWREARAEVRVEEFWTPPAGGLMLGAGRGLRGGKLEFFEHMRIEERGTTLVFVALPFGENSTEFVLKTRNPHELLFENEAHDYPKRIRYRLEPDGTLVARIEGDGGSGEEWHFSRAQ
jgi:hypothetical protein